MNTISWRALQYAAGNVYIADGTNNRVRKVDANTGIINTIAGNGTSAFFGDGGTATSAMFNSVPGNVYLADTNNDRIRRVDAATDTITTIAGTGSPTYGGDGSAATEARLAGPVAVALDAEENVYIATILDSRIRKIDANTGIITTIASNGTARSPTTAACGDGGQATSAMLNMPWGVRTDAAGNVYIADQANQRVRKVDPSGVITTIAGGGPYTNDGIPATVASLFNPNRIALDGAGNVYISDLASQRIRKVSSGLSFPQTTVGQSTSQYVFLQINGSLTITSIASDSSEYVPGAVTGCSIGTSLSAGTICNIPTTFTPAFSGVRGASLIVTTNVGTFEFGLTGIGVP